GDLLLTYVILMTTIVVCRVSLTTPQTGLLLVITLAFWAVAFYGPAGSYYYRLKSFGTILKELIRGSMKAFFAFTAAIFFSNIPLPAGVVMIFFAADLVALMLFRLSLTAALRHYRRLGGSVRKVLIIGTGPRAQAVADRICDNPPWGIQIIGFLDYHRTGLWRYRDLPLLGHPDGLPDYIAGNQVDYIIIAVESEDLVLTTHAFAAGEEMGVAICQLTDFYYHPISKPYPTRFMDFPAVVYSSAPEDRLQMSIKACLDRLLGIFALLLSIPAGIITAAAIKLEDRGPVFFKQVRSGKNGKPFTMYKFRTMVPDAEKLKARLMDRNEMSGPVFKIANDPRITRIGAVLRKTSIDELPQLINVLRGEMSLVGPRPPLPKEVAAYDRWQRRKLAVKPGLTCLWQVNGRNRIDFEDWMKLDLQYIDNWSLWLDTKILVKTVPAVFKRSGAS
ncbi:MAG: sugar transferase, partial [candidate division Zixibacteria bacterium]|nr:sugar transferase [candidate division Zixibacteria bacterium]